MFIPFMWHKESEPWETVPAPAGLTLHVGTALTNEGGTLQIAAGAVKPTHICMEEVEKTEDGQKVHAERVRMETIYETELSAASADIAAGAKYIIDAAGEKLTATTGENAEVVSFDGTEAGDKVRVRFS